MADDPTAALREQARERGRRILAHAPFDAFADRATLLLTAPPDGVELPFAPGTIALWLILEPAAARALPDPHRSALIGRGSYVAYERPRDAALSPLELTITLDPIPVLEAINRRALEARWTVRHAEPLHDRLGRHPQLVAAASLYPEDGPERVVRGLWLQAVAAVRAIWVVGRAPAAAALPAAGEASAALARLACAYDEGDHPTVDLLLPVARQTRIGRRLASWLDDLGAAVAGDAPATRRVAAAAEQVLREVAAVLGELYRDRPWLREPEAYALRAPR